MLEQAGLDFGRRDGESLVLDHLLAAVDDLEEAVAVDAGDVAGEIPAVAEGGGGGVGCVPVSEHELGAAHEEFAGGELEARGLRREARGAGGVARVHTSVGLCRRVAGSHQYFFETRWISDGYFGAGVAGEFAFGFGSRVAVCVWAGW